MQDLREDLIQAALSSERSKPRSVQTMVGPSQVGNPCDRSLAYDVAVEQGSVLQFCPELLSGTRPESDPWRAIVGTAVHAWLDLATSGPRWMRGVAVEAALFDGDYEPLPLSVVRGHIDLYDTETCTMVDHKVLGRSSTTRLLRDGPPPKYRVQGHLYALGLVRLGLRVDKVAIAAWPRDGLIRDLYVWDEPFDGEFAGSALSRLAQIRGAVRAGAGGLGWFSAEPSPSTCRYCPLVDVCEDSE